MTFQLKFTKVAAQTLKDLAATPDTAKKLAKVRRTLARIEQNPRHPGLNSHPYSSLSGANDEKVWDSYVENKTPHAWRIFWHYGPDQATITIVMITPHP